MEKESKQAHGFGASAQGNDVESHFPVEASDDVFGDEEGHEVCNCLQSCSSKF